LTKVRNCSLSSLRKRLKKRERSRRSKRLRGRKRKRSARFERSKIALTVRRDLKRSRKKKRKKNKGSLKNRLKRNLRLSSQRPQLRPPNVRTLFVRLSTLQPQRVARARHQLKQKTIKVIKTLKRR
jgi:hypothetical protein